MGWRDRIENTRFSITTGDGRQFFPLWKSGETSIEFNNTVYDFIAIDGSLIDRRKVKAENYPLTFWFQGDDNIEQGKDFRDSSKDSRAWLVRHPFYGDITGQPISIKFNDTSYNCTEVTVDFWETLTDVFPKTSSSLSDSLSALSVEYSTTAALNYSTKVDIKPADITRIRENVNNIALTMASLINKDNYTPYVSAVNKVMSNIDAVVFDGFAVITSIHDLIILPAQFGLALSSRVELFQSLFNSALLSLNIKLNKNTKAYFESVSGSIIAALADTLINPLPGDYKVRTDIQLYSAMLSTTYDTYLKTLDSAYVSIQSPSASFSASNTTQALLQSLVIQAITGLNALAFDAKQERIITLATDSNLILLTHQYVGLDAADINIAQFRQINNIKNKELFLVKKGRQIKYYV